MLLLFFLRNPNFSITTNNFSLIRLDLNFFPKLRKKVTANTVLDIILTIKFQATAQDQGVSAMPTFIFYRNKVKIDSQRGADPNALEEKIKKWYGESDDEGGDEVTVKGHVSVCVIIHVYRSIYKQVRGI